MPEEVETEPVVTVPTTPPQPPTTPPIPQPTVVDSDPMKDPRVQQLVEDARRQEKDKLYNRIEELSSWRKEQEKKEQDRVAAEEAAQKAAADEERARQEEELSAKELLLKEREEWNSRFTELQTQNEMERALREKEGQLREITEYRLTRLQEETENIIPSLVDFVTGSTVEEIDASIAKAIQKSNEILEASTEAMQSQRQAQRGVNITTPPVGPADINESTVSLTPEQIRNMSMEDYAKMRGTLLGAASDQAHGRGLLP